MMKIAGIVNEYFFCYKNLLITDCRKTLLTLVCRKFTIWRKN